jgi:hypothetical protein
MLDALGYVLLVAILPLILLPIVFALPLTARVRWALGAVLVAWFVWTALASRSGALAGMVLPVVVATIIILTSSQVRAVIAGANVSWLIAVQVSRLAGASFLLLHDAGRLANPFAVIAGWGDITAAVLAVPAAIIAYRAGPGWHYWVLSWNIIGFVDFLSAVFLGATSQPGSPIQLFTELPGAAVLGELPWRFIPGYYVPLFLIIHIALFVRLWQEAALSRHRHATSPSVATG